MSNIDVRSIRRKMRVSQERLAELIGVSLRTVQNYENGGVIPKSKYAILRDIGDSLMPPELTDTPKINYEQKGVPYYNVDFLCGFDLIENDQTINPDYYIDFKQYGEADFWINASGDSMRPTISSGDILAIRQLPENDWQDHLMYGEIYAIITTQNRTIKKVRKSTLGNDFLRLIPENTAQYDEQDIKKITVLRVFQVLGCMKKLI